MTRFTPRKRPVNKTLEPDTWDKFVDCYLRDALPSDLLKEFRK